MLRNTFLNARMGPLAEYNLSSINYSKGIGSKDRICWADMRRQPLAVEGAEEDDLINKYNIESVIIHHHYDSSQLKSSLATSKRIAFGPKYTGEGKLDFYSHNNPSNENRKEDLSEFDMDSSLRTSGVEQIQRAKFVPITNTR